MINFLLRASYGCLRIDLEYDFKSNGTFSVKKFGIISKNISFFKYLKYFWYNKIYWIFCIMNIKKFKFRNFSYASRMKEQISFDSCLKKHYGFNLSAYFCVSYIFFNYFLIILILQKTIKYVCIYYLDHNNICCCFFFLYYLIFYFICFCSSKIQYFFYFLIFSIIVLKLILNLFVNFLTLGFIIV